MQKNKLEKPNQKSNHKAKAPPSNTFILTISLPFFNPKVYGSKPYNSIFAYEGTLALCFQFML